MEAVAVQPELEGVTQSSTMIAVVMIVGLLTGVLPG